MSLSRGINASSTTNTKNRTPGSVSPFSGMCSTCKGDCPGLCEVGRSAYRGREVIYPQPFGDTTFASEKDYPVDLSHFNIMGTALGAMGVDATSDEAVFNNVNTEVALGKNKELKLKLPIVIPGMGSTKVASDYWEGLAAGAAISGVAIVIGENICGMDMQSRFKNGKVIDSPELKRRLDAFNRWNNGYGAIVLQSNVEDTNFGVLEYALGELGVSGVEIKWGQGAKSIGGEVKITDLDKALELSKRGYVVHPDPENEEVQRLFKKGVINEFERHSRVGMVDDADFIRRVHDLRRLGAKYVFLKTGAYRPRDLARAIKLASEAGIDLLTIDGAGGGTGMSPWRMMNEWGLPTVHLASLARNYLQILDESNLYVPPVAMAGGLSLEDHIFKILALGAPYFKMAGMARAPLTAAMVGANLESRIAEGNLGNSIKEKYGNTIEDVFEQASQLEKEQRINAHELPAGALGVYTYFSRLNTGLQQLMCGARKFSLEYIGRDDIGALTEDAAKVSGIDHVMDMDYQDAVAILKRSLAAVV